MAKTRYRDYVEGWKDKVQREDRALEQSRQERLRVAKQMAELLSERFGARCVYLFGSLAHGERMHELSDIDLAVEGLSPDRYFRALAELWEMLPPGVELDLVPLEYATPEMLQVVRDDGTLIHARE